MRSEDVRIPAGGDLFRLQEVHLFPFHTRLFDVEGWVSLRYPHRIACLNISLRGTRVLLMVFGVSFPSVERGQKIADETPSPPFTLADLLARGRAEASGS
jgi:hypothetical protein